MKLPSKKILHKSLIILFEFLAVIVLITIVASGALMWRLSSGPVSIEFARKYIEQALSDPDEGVEVNIGEIVLQWSNPVAPVMLGMKDLRVKCASKTDVFSVSESAITLSIPALVHGNIHPEYIMLRSPSLHLKRAREGDFSLGISSGKTTQEEAKEEDKNDEPDDAIITGFKNWALQKQDEGSVPAILEDLESLVIEDANLTIEDYKLGVKWTLPEIGIAVNRHEDGADIDVNFNIPMERGNSKVEALFRYRSAADEFTLSAKINDFDPEDLGKQFEKLSRLKGHDIRLDAEMKVWMNSQLVPSSISAKISSEKGKINIPELYNEPREFDAFSARIDYNLKRNILKIPEVILSLGGIDVRLETETDLSGDEILLPLAVSIYELPINTAEDIFPPKLENTSAHQWLVERMENGKLQDIKVNTELKIAKSDASSEIQNIHAEFDFENVDVDYEAPLMPAEKSSGHGMFDYREDRLLITGKNATIGDMAASDVKLDFTDVTTIGGGMVDITARLKGPLQTVLKYLAREPIAYGEELGIDPEAVEGSADLDLHISFPTVKDLKKEEVKIGASGTFSDVVLPEIVSGLSLTGGPFAINVYEEYFTVGGKGLLEKRDVDFDWKQYFYSAGKPFSSQVKASIGADRELREHFGAALDDFLSGTVPLDLVYTYQISGKSTVDVTADLQSVVGRFDPLEYLKPAGQEGKAEFQIMMTHGNPNKIADLRITAPRLSISGGNLFFGEVLGEIDVNKASIEHMKMNGNDFGVEYERDASGLMKMAIAGAYLDARPMLKGKDKNKGSESGMGEKKKPDEPPMIISANVAVMQTEKEKGIKNVKLYTTLDETSEITQLEMDAKCGNGDIYMRYKPDADTGQKEFRLEATDAGAFLRSFGIYENVTGGKLTIVGDPSGHKMRNGDLSGVAKLVDFKVVKAPTLAKLLGAMSLTGINQLLGNEGLVFSRLEAKFEWIHKPQGAILIVSDGRTSGNSLGLTFEGKANKETEKINVSGTIVPLSSINSIVGSIPVVGDLLTGGEGGAIFAATYKIEGEMKNPEISVNPLAALAPGILRRILFEGGQTN